MRYIIVCILLSLYPVRAVLAADTALSTSWKRLGGPYTSLVDAVAAPPVPVNVTTPYPIGEGKVVIVYNVHSIFSLRSEHSSTPTQVQPGVLLHLANTNLTLESAHELTLTNSEYPLTSHGVVMSRDGKSILVSIYVEGPTDRSKIRLSDILGGSETSCQQTAKEPGIYIAQISIKSLSCIRLDGPLKVGDCQSSRGVVQISPVAPDGSEWFATACMEKCNGESSHAAALFHHLSGEEHDTHGWIVAHSTATSSLAISALALADVDRNIRRVNLGINYQFRSTTPSASDVVNVVSDPKATPPAYKPYAENVRGLGTVLYLATLTGPFSSSQLETSAVRPLATEKILSISTLHPISGSQDALISGLIDADSVTQAFIGVAAPPGLSSTFRNPPITTKSTDGDTHVLSLLSCQIVGHNAYLTFCAHGSRWTLGDVAPPAESPAGGVFTVKLHMESSLMIDKKFLWQAAGLPLLAEDVVRVGRATLFPSMSPVGALVLSVDSDLVGMHQIMATAVALPASTFPHAGGAPTASSHGNMEQASPGAAWGFTIGMFALTAVVGFFAWRYWKANGAEDWQKILDQEKRQAEIAL
eukprot:TRINITY_DN10246_c0_g1_i1.p1 TRINITY_DN10246_c0_g1~~TRINITY_DN10246_c0_g1_i1.p1  ORF type:complete len:587 (+),score=66.60 TRINITY_DN10246_c0_g1_i1:395-2155(+)